MPTAPDTSLTCLACLCKSLTERDNIRDGTTSQRLFFPTSQSNIEHFGELLIALSCMYLYLLTSFSLEFEWRGLYSLVFWTLYTNPRKYVLETIFGAKMEMSKSPDQHHNVIIPAGGQAMEIIENTCLPCSHVQQSLSALLQV